MPSTIKQIRAKKSSLYISFDVGIRNVAFCVVRETPAHFDVLDWAVCDILESNGVEVKNALHVSVDRLVRLMYQSLSRLFTAEKIARYLGLDPKCQVVIEYQMNRGPKNMILSAVIMTFFMHVGIDGDHIHLYSAKHKFSVIKHVIPEVVDAETKSGQRPGDKDRTKKAAEKRYRSNKRLAKKATKAIVSSVAKCCVADDESGLPENLSDLFKRGAGKCDDLADCFLQALSVCAFEKLQVNEPASSLVIDDNEHDDDLRDEK